MHDISVITFKVEKKGRVIKLITLGNVPFSYTDTNTNQEKHCSTDTRGLRDLKMKDGEYKFTVKSFETYGKYSTIETVPLLKGQTITLQLSDPEQDYSYLNRRLQSLINKGDERSLNKATQLLAQVKDTYHNYQEIPKFRKIIALEKVLENKLLQNAMEERFASND